MQRIVKDLANEFLDYNLFWLSSKKRTAEDYAISLKTSVFKHVVNRKSIRFTLSRKVYWYGPQKEIMTAVLVEMLNGKRYFKVDVFLCF